MTTEVLKYINTMQNFSRFVQWVVFSLFISSCATVAKGPRYSEAKSMKAEPGFATVYVFREYAEPTAWGSEIQINGKPAATLNQGGFTWVYSKPGKTEIKAVWSGMSGQKDSFISIDTVEGKTYYVEVKGISKADPGYLVIYFKVGSGLNEVKPNVAVKKLETCCKFQKPVSDVL
jgi:hypothetical protein